eukprot:Gb_29439 [translate_table: standard]
MGTKTKRKHGQVVAFAGAAAIAVIAGRALLAVLRGRRKGYPGLNIRVNLTASEILKLAERIIAESRQVHDLVASVSLDKVTYANVIAPLADLEAEHFVLVQSCVLPRMVAPSKDVREASIEAEKRINAHNLKCSMREDVYRVVKAFAARGEWLDPEAQRYVTHLVRDFERKGVNLSSDRRAEIERLKARIEELCTTFVNNLSEENNFLLFSESDLAGMPSDFLKKLDKMEDGKLKVNLKNPHTYMILERCKVGATRRAVATARGQRCLKDNTAILEDLVQLRHKMACLLGYRNYAEYVVETRMAKTPSKVMEFLDDISQDVSDLAAKELRRLQDLKREEEGEIAFRMEDLQYYMCKAEELELDMDNEIVMQYFPVNIVTPGIFRIYQDLFGLKFERVQGAEVWHPDVCLFSVFDSTSNDLLGYFYLDLYPRDGKCVHACVLALQNSCLSRNDVRQLPVATMVANFSKPTKDNSALLQFSEVVTYFHEFGHVVHHICSRASFAKFSGLRVEADFVEVPSQMLENWCYESAPLKMMTGFYQDIHRPVSDEICRALKQKQNAFCGLKTKQQILLCLFDQIIHTSEKVDTKALLKDLHPKVMLGIPLLEGTNPAASFLQLAVGYDATCYSYVWSEVFAADMFVSKFEGDILNRSAGMQYRNKVLAPGGTKDAFDIVHEFLEREPSKEAYMKKRGIL